MTRINDKIDRALDRLLTKPLASIIDNPKTTTTQLVVLVSALSALDAVRWYVFESKTVATLEWIVAMYRTTPPKD